MRALLDTNVVLDFVLARHPFFVEADKIFIKLQNGEFTAFVSAITPINVFYVTRKERSKDIAFQSVEQLLRLVEIAQCDKLVFKNALMSNFTDYEDAIQHESALAENLDVIVTRNTKDFANASVPVSSPAEFLKNL